jgi:hypothetical protein
MDHVIIKDIITDQEQNNILNYVNSQKNKMQSYFKFGPQPDYFIPVSFIDINKIDLHPKFIKNIINRVQDLFGLSYENPYTNYGWAISYGYKGSAVLPHKDPFNKKNIDDISFRMNIIIQNSDNGGKFVFHYKNGDKIIEIPEKALMIFPASEIEHSISKNLGKKTRINLSIDAIVKDKFWLNIQKTREKYDFYKK